MNIEESLEQLPDIVADKLVEWRKASLWRESKEAVLYLKYKGAEGKTATEIKALINANDERYAVILEEIKAEGEYNRYYERLMSAKKLASLRTAF